MKRKLDINKPNTVDDITLGQFQKYLKLVEGLGETPEYNEFTKMHIVSIFCNVPLELIRSGFKARDIDRISKDILNLINELTKDKEDEEEYKFKPTFKLGEATFGFINNFEDMLAGEYADLTTYFNKWETMHRAMAVMYRPVVKTKFNPLLKLEQYEIEKYDGTDEYGELMKQMPAIKAIEASFFLTNSFLKLQQRFLLYLEKQVKENPEISMTLKANSIEIGDSIKDFTALLDKRF